MHCNKCGAEVKEGEKFCTKCGAELVVQNNVQSTPQNNNSDSKATASLVLGIISIVVPCVGFITALVGLILGIVSKERSGKRTAGIIVNAIALLLIIISTILLFFFGVIGSRAVTKAVEDEWNNTIDKYESEFENTFDNDYYDDGDNDDTSKKDSTTKDKSTVISKAKSYINTLSFSRSGLIKQLEFEGYSHDDAVYGADNCGADWNEQAVKKAKSYLRVTTFTHSELVEQLEFEGFTHEQAEYGATQAGV